MADPDFIVGIIGNIISVLLQAAPYGAFRDIVKKKTAEEYNAIPYIAQLLCKSLWTFYGVADPRGLLLITVNAVGVFAQCLYVLIYLIFVPKEKKVKSLVVVGIVNICFPAAAICVAVFVFHDDHRRRMFMGYLCATVTIAMYAAPFSVMATVIKMKSVRFMPFYLSLFLLLNAGAWFAYALIQKDVFVIVPNGLGILSSSAQIIIYMIYKNESPVTNSMHISFPSARMGSARIGSVHDQDIMEEGGSIRKDDVTEEGDIGKATHSSVRRMSISSEFIVENVIAMSQNEAHSGLLLVVP